MPDAAPAQAAPLQMPSPLSARAAGLFSRLGRARGPALALLGLGLVALPLPQLLVDGLLVIGLAAAVALLALAVAAGELRRAPRFPSLLLGVLLLRFALSVA